MADTLFMPSLKLTTLPALPLTRTLPLVLPAALPALAFRAGPCRFTALDLRAEKGTDRVEEPLRLNLLGLGHAGGQHALELVARLLAAAGLLLPKLHSPAQRKGK